MPLKLDNTPGHPEPQEFNSKGTEVVYLSPQTRSLIQPIDQGSDGPFRLIAHNSMERTVKAVEVYSSRENIMKVWKDYTTEDAIVLEKAMNAIRPGTINACWRKLSPHIVHDFTEFTTKPIKKIMKEIVVTAKNGWG